jgi:hypothetical protein
MRHLAGITLRESQFSELSSICAADQQFPQEWELWKAFIEESARVALRSGEPVVELGIEPAAFKVWCEHVGVVPGLDALRAYAILRRRLLIAA